MFGRKSTTPTFTLDQFDAAAKALAEHITQRPVEEPFAIIENDRWYVLARVVLEGAGLREEN